MRQLIRAAGLAAALALAPLAAAAAEAGDALFTERGPWSLGDETVAWSLTRQGPPAEGFRPIEDGSITLTEVIDPSDGAPALEVTQDDGTRSRRIGLFPVSSGDPVLTIFLEQTVRDMAAITGGNPDYIRNRIKDAVFRGGEIRQDGAATVASFQPFASDPNAARMAGFETLSMTFVMDDPAEPIRQMLAETDPASGATYRAAMVRQ
mgnify:CR=1 FL=1